MSNLERIRFNGESLLDALYPIGYQYVMHAVAASDDPDVAFPVAQRPEAMWPNTTWELLWADGGVFFRTEGTGGFTDVDTGRVDGLQRDQMQRITGATNSYICASTSGGTVGAVTMTYLSRQFGSGSTGFYNNLSINSANSPDARASASTAGETRPTNRLFRIYRRTA
jgi:hypothetical protein